MSEQSVNNPRSSVARFHWMLPKGGEVSLNASQTPREASHYRLASTRTGSPAPRPDIAGWTHFCKHAEEAGIESLLVSFSRYEPDPILVTAALGQTTEKLKFIAAYRSGLMKPTTFILPATLLRITSQRSTLFSGRVILNSTGLTLLLPSLIPLPLVVTTP